MWIMSHGYHSCREFPHSIGTIHEAALRGAEAAASDGFGTVLATSWESLAKFMMLV